MCSGCLDDQGPRWARLAHALALHGATITDTGDAIVEAPALAH